MLSSIISTSWGSVTTVLASDAGFWHLMWDQLKAFFLSDFIIVFLGLFLGWFATWSWLKDAWRPKYEFLREPMRIAILVPLVLLIVTFGEHNTRLAIHKQVAEEAHVKAERVFVSTETELRTSAPKLKPNDQLNILSQGIGKIAGRTFDWVQNTYPNFELRTLSVFLYLGNDCNDRTGGCIEDVVQEGELEKNRRYFLRSSLVGATITKGERKYCPDLSITQEFPDCETFQPPPAGMHLEFASVLCYPVTLGTGPGGEEPFAAVCLDSTRRHAFDHEEDAAWEGIRDQVSCVATLLYEFHQIRDRPGVKKAHQIGK